MSQKIKDIEVKKLVLWTENPRDPVRSNAKNQKIADRAISGGTSKKWNLRKLFKSMGNRYDYSELPTVVYVNRKPVIYDGNRRVLIGKIIHGYVQVKNCPNFSGFEFPESIPCNVCDLKTALEHVDRKHADSGSWDTLERDIFRHKHMKEKLSSFLVIEKATHLISSNPALNQRFVKEEIFDETTLRELGFVIENNKLIFAHKNNYDANAILDYITYLVESKELSTRKNRGKVLALLNKDKNIKKILDRKGEIPTLPYSRKDETTQAQPPKTPNATKGREHNLFGENTLSLVSGSVENIYHDLMLMYKNKDKKEYSPDFPRLMRMGIRLLCELAAQDEKLKLDEYIDSNHEAAKTMLSQDEKTTLSVNSTTSSKILIKNIQIGAHGYTASNNLHQTIAISLIVGKMLEITHGR